MIIHNHTLKKRTIFFILCVLFIFWITVLLIVRVPSNERVWSEDQAVLPHAEFVDDVVYIKNIRNFTYTSKDEYIPSYYDKKVIIADIETVDYIVEPLASVAVAHTLLSFGLSDGSRIAISVEIRKEAGEDFSPTKGMFQEYEIMYVVVDERDALILRAVHRDNPVYIYPTVASKESVQKLFVDMLTRATELTKAPEFYNTLTNTCATNIADHINNIVPEKVTWDYRLLLPKDSDVLAYELGFIDNSVPLEDLRKTYLANENIKRYVGSSNFSTAIRDSFTTDLAQ